MKKVFLRTLLVTFMVAVGSYVYYTLPDVSELKQKNPKTTALMELREEEYKKKGIGGPRQQIWTSYGATSEHLKKAVLISEDAAFFSHRGIDVNELKAALKKDWETWSFSRGGSTITMQLAKNLYLSPSKNPLRKTKEIIIAWQLEQKLSKRRNSGSSGIGHSRRPTPQPAQCSRAKSPKATKRDSQPARQCRLPEQRRIPAG
jgi:monofunctional biosynthetic peptidoglycan transglycosylase